MLLNLIKVIVWGCIIAYCVKIAEKHHLNKVLAFCCGFLLPPFALLYYWYYDYSSKKEIKKFNIKL